MSNSKLTVKIQTLVAAAIAVGLVGLSAPTAHAARNDGRLPSAVSGCSSNVWIGGGWDTRITAWNPHIGQYEDYGWFEWRYSGTGSCNGYQWIRLHIEKDLWIYGDGLLHMAECRADGVCVWSEIQPSQADIWVQVGGMAQVFASVLRAGSYFDAQMIYSPTMQSCANFTSDAIVNNYDYWSTSPIGGFACG